MESSSSQRSSSAFDIETYISRYNPTSTISLQRLLFLSCTTNDKDASQKGFQLLEQRLKAKGNTKMYIDVFRPQKPQPKELEDDEIVGGGDGMDVDNDMHMSEGGGSGGGPAMIVDVVEPVASTSASSGKLLTVHENKMWDLLEYIFFSFLWAFSCF